ncbi:hypothetical protein ABPG75_000978 [Micractinium tetrahymenae]
MDLVNELQLIGKKAADRFVAAQQQAEVATLERARLQAQLGKLQQKLEQAEGLQQELLAEKQRAAESDAAQAALQQQLDRWLQRAHSLEQELVVTKYKLQAAKSHLHQFQALAAVVAAGQALPQPEAAPVPAKSSGAAVAANRAAVKPLLWWLRAFLTDSTVQRLRNQLGRTDCRASIPSPGAVPDPMAGGSPASKRAGKRRNSPDASGNRHQASKRQQRNMSAQAGFKPLTEQTGKDSSWDSPAPAPAQPDGGRCTPQQQLAAATATASAAVGPLPDVDTPAMHASVLQQQPAASGMTDRMLQEDAASALREFLDAAWLNKAIVPFVEELLKTPSVHTFFAEPVNVKAVPDYLDWVKQPMDLGTIPGKAARGKYRTPQEWKVDMDLVISNARTYNSKKNGGGAAVLRAAKDLERKLHASTSFYATVETQWNTTSDSRQQPASVLE